MNKPAAMRAAPSGSSVISKDWQVPNVERVQRLWVTTTTTRRMPQHSSYVSEYPAHTHTCGHTCSRMPYAAMCDTKRFRLDSTPMMSASTMKLATLHRIRSRFAAVSAVDKLVFACAVKRHTNAPGNAAASGAGTGKTPTAIAGTR